MRYSIGDKVVYPHRGAGAVTDVEHLELVEGFDQYYVIDIPATGLTVRVPVDMVDALDVRPVLSESRLEQMLDLLGKKASRLPDDYKVRQIRVREKLASGRATPIAEVVRDLKWREERSYLTRVDRRLLEEAREFLAAEVALITGSEISDAHEVIDAALAQDLT
jgi:RNA polymerase-interacting CarD/CdnL/TRCF family regulator